MARRPRISGKDVISRLEKLGFERARQKGSHVVLRRQTPEGRVGCVVPLHDELAEGTLKGILKQAKLTIEEFTEDL